jgi:hypothetical protein
MDRDRGREKGSNGERERRSNQFQPCNLQPRMIRTRMPRKRTLLPFRCANGWCKNRGFAPAAVSPAPKTGIIAVKMHIFPSIIPCDKMVFDKEKRYTKQMNRCP